MYTCGAVMCPDSNLTSASRESFVRTNDLTLVVQTTICPDDKQTFGSKSTKFVRTLNQTLPSHRGPGLGYRSDSHVTA
jgi:hypothetical protein